MDKADSLSQARQNLADFLRLNSLRNTPERNALLEAIYQAFFERTDKNRGVIRLICSGCGKTTEMNSDKVRRQIAVMRTRRFNATGWVLNVYGFCSKCTADLKRKQNRLNKKDKEKK